MEQRHLEEQEKQQREINELKLQNNELRLKYLRQKRITEDLMNST